MLGMVYSDWLDKTSAHSMVSYFRLHQVFL